MKIKSLIILFIFISCNTDINKLKDINMENYKVRAPEFKTGLDWLNTNTPLTLKQLRGKIVLIDFWTYCCINCMHILPELKRLEEKYKNELVVIGVHSAKFNTEKETDNIRQAILRYNISHPVVNDHNFDIWRQYSAHAWPTLVLIDPNGYIVGSHSGEGIFDIFDYNIENLIKKHKNDLNTDPINFSLEKDKKQKSYLSFPGKIISDSDNNKLIISDSGNNRILILDVNGNILQIIGNGKQGNKNGNFSEAEFNSPQGVVLYKNDILFIADTENHTIRKADLKTGIVETIAGLGYQVYNRFPKGNAKDVGLNSPWDLTIAEDILYIAMAGPHQIWKIDLNSNLISLHAGNGYENIVDDKLLNSQLAQPSGLTTDGLVLYFADSEVSAIRKADINTNGYVKTLIGSGLFDFGDKDGNLKKALLQHPIGLAYNNNKIYIADTYNNKIKELDLKNNNIKTLAGNGKEGNSDGDFEDALFNEPSGLAYLNNKIYVADTNNDLIRVLDLTTKKVSTLIIKPKPESDNLQLKDLDIDSTISVFFDKITKFNINVNIPKGTIINPEIKSTINFYDNSGILINSFNIEGINNTYNVNLVNNGSPVYATAFLYFCDKSNNGLCYITNKTYKIENGNSGTLVNITL